MRFLRPAIFHVPYIIHSPNRIYRETRCNEEFAGRSSYVLSAVETPESPHSDRHSEGSL